jgi:hypothetical protein
MEKACARCKNEFSIDSDELSFYEKMSVPVPNVCPDCRFKMRAVWRNEMSLYTGRKCGLCDKSIVTMYNPKSPYIVYCNECYRGDSWDPRSYAKDYDFNRPFFEQLGELFLQVPKNTLFHATGVGSFVNSDFTNCSGGLKNCYLSANCTGVEDGMYSRGITYSTEVLDSYFGAKIEKAYESINTQKSSGIVFCQNINGCVDSYFLLNCSGCTDCFGCVNLRNKSNCFLNEQLSREEYKKRISEIVGSHEKLSEFKKEFENFALKFPRRENNNLNVVDSIGDYLTDCKNLKYSFEIMNGEESRWNFSSRDIKDSFGTIGYGIKSEMLLEVTSTGCSSRVIGSCMCEVSQNIEYCVSCVSTKNLIGCDSLKNAEYCILNKQYEKEEYEKIRAHIVKELTNLGIYGLMMPPELAPFAYNETIGQDNMPMTKEEALAQGFRWEDDIQMTKGKETMLPENIPDHIRDMSDDIVKEILKCEGCERNYKITDQELFFYRKMILPIPRKCFYCRHKNRIERRGPYKFWKRNCSHCEKEITTNYAPERPEIVYCESCYQREVI